jgi:segregation and condensation protein A
MVALDVFEGPLDLLLRLIERKELDITLVSLALVTDQYMAHLAGLRELSAEGLADFLGIAAQLLVIKSRVLLPQPEEEQDGEDEDWEDDLVYRLREYRRFKEVALQLGEMERVGHRAFARVAPPPRVQRQPVFGQASVEELVQALKRALEAHPPAADVDEVVSPVTVHISDCIRAILTNIQPASRIRFSALMRRAGSRMEIIVTFLALLELIKQQRVRATQAEAFGEIYLEARAPNPDDEIPPTDLSEYGEAGDDREPMP